MAAALQFAARKLCGCALQRPPQPYLTAVAEATIKEERRHGGSTLRRFSTESQNVVKNNKLGAMSEANPAAASPPINNAQATSPPPIWSPRNKMFLPLAAGPPESLLLIHFPHCSTFLHALFPTPCSAAAAQPFPLPVPLDPRRVYADDATPASVLARRRRDCVEAAHPDGTPARCRRPHECSAATSTNMWTIHPAHCCL
ncbi:unnamed protein product [Triticum aestivum]|uniref:Uncharacterized protein n=1 Tax=Triticum aestivum TaxID=4565 RepID=A0A7H4LK62_WHEAT|nr:unnamed protein product [Triticum aestivum]